ncbi:MAG: discoidin domain-containing protein, partial [Opitutae bacterium]|nr:discoidin domain-containing protein [Opitutae bacterium]
AVSRVQTHPDIKTVKASSFQAGNPPVHAVDADTTSRWAARDGSFPQFLEVELKAPQQVNGVTLTFRNKTVIQYTIDVLGADGKWKTIVDQSENDKEVQTVTHSLDADISKLKVSVLYARQGWATITDLQMTFPKGKRHSGQ